MKKIIFTLAIFLFAFLLIQNAEAMVIKQSTAIDLKVPCFNDEDLCGAATTCNITIFHPDSSALIDNQAMTNSVAYFNYSLSSSQTSVLGEHRVSMVCWDGTDTGASIFILKITPNGEDDDNDILKLAMIISIGIIMILFLPLLLKAIEDTVHLEMTVRWLGIYFGYFFAMLFVYMISKNYIFDSNTLDLLLTFIKMGGIVFIFITVIGFILTLTLGEWRKMKPPSEDY